jgi:hypothetical protein
MSARPTPPKEIPLAQAAQRLREGYTRTYRRVLSGQLSGGWRDGHWMVSVPDLERLAAELERDAGGAR